MLQALTRKLQIFAFGYFRALVFTIYLFISTPTFCTSFEMEDLDHVVDSDPLSSNVEEEKEKESSSDNEPLFDNDVDEDVVGAEGTKKVFDEDLFVVVSDPDKKVFPMETYISYKVTTKTTRSTFDESEFVVQRRYGDFVWLSGRLEEEYPSFIIPPLPPKFVMKGMFDRFSAEFTQIRCHALNRFLNRISKHPVISYSEHLKTFLTAMEFSSSQKQSILSRMSSSLKWSRINNVEFEPVNENATAFCEKMGALDRIGERLLGEKKELASYLKEFSPTFSEWSQSEDDVLEPIMNSIANCLESCAEEADTNAQQHEQKFLPLIKEYILYADMVKQALKRRDIFESQFEKCSEELRQKKNEKENLPKSDQSYSLGALMGKSPETVREQKEEKLTHQIGELSAQKEKLSDALERANSNFRADMDRWKEVKTKDMATAFSDFADAQIKFHNNCFAAWDNILPAMQTPSAASGNPNEIET